AFDGTNYLVVYRNYEQIIGMRVSPAGAILDAPDGFNIGLGFSGPAIAFDGTNYLVVWGHFVPSDADPSGGYDIFGAHVTKQGQVLDDPALTIFAAAGEQYSPSVAFDGVNYLVVWHDRRDDVDVNIMGSRITTAGVNIDPDGIAISTAPGVQDTPTVVFAAGN